MNIILLCSLLATGSIVAQEANLAPNHVYSDENVDIFTLFLGRLAKYVATGDKAIIDFYTQACLMEAYFTSCRHELFYPELYAEKLMRIQIVLGRPLTNEEINDRMYDDV